MVRTPSTHGSCGDLKAQMPLNDSEFQRYLKLLDLRREKPSITALTRIVRQHLITIPFENISKLYRLKTVGLRRMPDLARYLEGIEQFHFGGTCYANNYFLHTLLRHLGYDADLCGADMSRPDVHIVNVVRVEGREFVVDAGYGAPFLEPLPRDLAVDFVVNQGDDRYVLRPTSEGGGSEMLLFRNGTFAHGYRVNPRGRQIEEFEKVVADSFLPEATFMNAILLVRFLADGSLVLHNMQYSEIRGTTTKRVVLDSFHQVVRTIEVAFGIPAGPVKVALEGLSLTSDAWGGPGPTTTQSSGENT